MPENGYHLAQINIGRIRAPLDHPVMEGFVSQLDAVNALAEQSPGFVWRFQAGGGNATAVQDYQDPLGIINLAVWETVEDLFNYVYRSAHSAALRERKSWFEPYGSLYMALWWVEAGQLPTVEEGKAKLELLTREGPTPAAFNFKIRFPAPSEGKISEE